ncbi:MAG: protease inhibitor I42 family protein [Candidatus Hydrogenedentota bacterium]
MLNFQISCRRAILIFVSACFFASCSTGSRISKTSFTAADRTIAVSKSESFVLRLESNPSEGYRWVWAQPLDYTVLALGNESFSAPETTSSGTGGYQEWHFRAVDAGSAVISLKYILLGSKDTVPIRTQETLVTVK